MEGTVFTFIFSRYLPHSYFNNSLSLFCISGCLEWVTQSPPLQTALDTETFRNVQEFGRCNIYVSGTKQKKIFLRPNPTGCCK